MQTSLTLPIVRSHKNCLAAFGAAPLVEFIMRLILNALHEDRLLQLSASR
jgi:hypothetical protein